MSLIRIAAATHPVRVLAWAWLLMLVASISACGGGGGGGGAGTSVAAPVTAPPPAPTPNFPTLLPSGSFQLAAIDAPPEHAVTAGVQRGVVAIGPDTAAPAGLTVELLDASLPAAAHALASTVTLADGSFSMSVDSSTVTPAQRWLQVRLSDGTVLRAYATGWTEISPGTEVALRELARLRKAGAFTAHELQVAELGAAQESLTFAWRGSFGELSVPAAVEAVTQFVRFHAPWNQLLDRFTLPAVTQGAGDVVGLGPTGDVIWTSTVTKGKAAPQTVALRSACCAGGSATASDPDLTEWLSSSSTGISLMPEGDQSLYFANDPNHAMVNLLSQVGLLPLIEFPYSVGTRVLYDDSQFTLKDSNNVSASIKVTRRTYPAAPFNALGRSVHAVQVVLDYEIAVLFKTTGRQIDLLARERRWFTPQGGRVRWETSTQRREGTQQVDNTLVIAADSVSGTFFASPVAPFAGVADVVSLGLRHRHAVFSAVLNKVYAATSNGGGQVLELDPATLATLRTVPMGAVPGRLAISADGARLYVGLDGGQLVELSTTDLAVKRQTTLPIDLYGVAYTRVYDMAVDPFDAGRVLVLAGQGGVAGVSSGAILVYREGQLALRDGPHYYSSDFGWGYYSPNRLAWSSVQDEYLSAFVGSPKSVYRFRTGATATTELASLARVDDTGWHDVGGEIVTDFGRVLDASSFAPLRTLSMGTQRMHACNRLDVLSDLCAIDNAVGYVWARLDHGSSAFLGSYRPAIKEVTNGCPEAGVIAGTQGLGEHTLTPMNNGRNLVSTLTGANQELCSLQVWTLHGVYP